MLPFELALSAGGKHQDHTSARRLVTRARARARAVRPAPQRTRRRDRQGCWFGCKLGVGQQYFPNSVVHLVGDNDVAVCRVNGNACGVVEQRFRAAGRVAEAFRARAR